MLTEAEGMAATRIDQSAPATVQGLQLQLQQAGRSQTAALRAILFPDEDEA